MARKPADQSVNREDILLAAADALREHGYDAATMKDIAARVNLTAASLYHHFKNKDHLLLAVLELGLAHAIEQMEPFLQLETGASDRLARMITAHVCEVTENPAVGAAMVFEIKSLVNAGQMGRGNGSEEFVRRRVQFFQQRDYFEKLFRQTIEEGIAAGEFRAVDAAIFAKTMLGAQNWVGVWYREGGRLSGEAIAERMIDIFLTSLRVQQPSAAS